MTEPPPAMEEEFNAWYDDEHMAERLAIPGLPLGAALGGRLPAGRRQVSGHLRARFARRSWNRPRYLARFQNQTPWSKRCLGQGGGVQALGLRAGRPSADPHPAAKAVVLVFNGRALSLPGTLQIRKFAAPPASRSPCTSWPTPSSSRLPTASTSLERYAWLSVAAALATIGAEDAGLVADRLGRPAVRRARVAGQPRRRAARALDAAPRGLAAGRGASLRLVQGRVLLRRHRRRADRARRRRHPRSPRCRACSTRSRSRRRCSGLGVSFVASLINLGAALVLMRAGKRAPQHHAGGRRQAPDDRRLDLGRRDRRRGAGVRHRLAACWTRWSRWRWPSHIVWTGVGLVRRSVSGPARCRHPAGRPARR